VLVGLLNGQDGAARLQTIASIRDAVEELRGLPRYGEAHDNALREIRTSIVHLLAEGGRPPAETIPLLQQAMDKLRALVELGAADESVRAELASSMNELGWMLLSDGVPVALATGIADAGIAHERQQRLVRDPGELAAWRARIAEIQLLRKSETPDAEALARAQEQATRHAVSNAIRQDGNSLRLILAGKMLAFASKAAGHHLYGNKDYGWAYCLCGAHSSGWIGWTLKSEGQNTRTDGYTCANAGHGAGEGADAVRCGPGPAEPAAATATAGAKRKCPDDEV
jgi:hypothetical protein